MSVRKVTSSSVIKFSGNDMLFTKGIVNVDFLVIGGGGGGRSTTTTRYATAGGGAGDYITSVFGESSGGGRTNPKMFVLTRQRQYRVVVGAGGAVNASGSPTRVQREDDFDNPLETVNAISGGTGGGAGTNDDRNGGASLSGGFGPRTGGTAGLMGFAYPGGDSFGSTTDTVRAAGGGGGASAAGSDGVSGVGGNGGNGLASSITGSSVTRAGGGGGACSDTNTQGTGGTGGGGNAAFNGTADSGTANTGSGGGGIAYSTSATAGAGGSGLVVFKYPNKWVLTVGVGLTSSTSTSGDYKITQFTTGNDIVTFS